MSWGDSWGESPGNNAKRLAAAFQDGRELRIGDHSVWANSRGRWVYSCQNTVIARRVPEDLIPEMVRDALEGRPWNVRPLEFCCGCADKATARHLRALGVDAQWQHGGDPFLMNGVDVSSGAWYTLDELATSPKWKPAPTTYRPKFVNLTMPLFS